MHGGLFVALAVEPHLIVFFLAPSPLFFETWTFRYFKYRIVFRKSMTRTAPKHVFRAAAHDICQLLRW